MENDNGVERQIEGEKKKKTIEGIKDSMLRISIEWVTAELVWIP